MLRFNIARCRLNWRAVAAAVVISVLPLAEARSTDQSKARHALLIANQDYAREVGKLANPVNDVRLLAKALADTGFAKENIRIVTNADRVTILGEVADFGRRLGAAGEGAIGFFYYSGHGAANNIDRRNYIIPVGAGRLDDRVWFKSVALDSITRQLAIAAPNAAHFVVFDACRNILKMPTRGAKGFEPVRERRGMLIAFSTEPGQTASDVGRDSGPYAAALAQELRKPGLDHLDIFQNVKEEVYRSTRVQVPWTRDGLLKRVTFTAKPKLKPKVTPPQKVAKSAPAAGANAKSKPQRLGGFAKAPQSSAAAAWNYAKDTKSCRVLTTFRKRFADTIWSDFALDRMRQLKCPTVVARKEPTPKAMPSKKPANKPEKRPVTAALPWTPRAGADQLRTIQAELRRLGCYGGEVDGQWGAGSMAALGAAYAGNERRSGPLARLTARNADNHIKALKKLPAGRCAAPVAKPPVIATPGTPPSSVGAGATPNAAAGASLVGAGTPDTSGAAPPKQKRCRNVLNEDALQDEKAPFMIEVCE